VLLSARLLDAIADPFIGRWADALYGRSPRQAYRWLAYAAVGLRSAFGPCSFRR
jgi:Na+/melibiose symporter-like transporter